MASGVNAEPIRLSVGGYAGYAGFNFPVAMEDVTSGNVFGFKARFAIMPKIGLEPNIAFSSYGDGEAEVYDETQTREGGDITGFGLDAVLGSIQGFPGISFYGIIGIGSAKWARDGIDDKSGVSYYFGIGVEYTFTTPITLEARAKTQIFPYEDGSYKNGILTFGVSYQIGVLGGGE
jgi:opacity protein-like surface antigen